MYRLFLAIVFMVIFIASLGTGTTVLAQTFLEKKCQELSNEITARQKDHDDSQVYLDQLRNDYQECAADKQSVEDAKAVLQSQPALGVKTDGQNWESLDGVSANTVTTP